ncbi:MAG: AraC family transcriptional regulator [Methyloceanibacter sp.]|nr:AraC family transcriptional regulator [Methyloceanibacter sp.]
MNSDLFEAFSKRPEIVNRVSHQDVEVYLARGGEQGDNWELDSTVQSDFVVFNTSGGFSNFALNSDKLQRSAWPKLSWSFHPSGTQVKENGVEPVAAPIVIDFSKGLTSDPECQTSQCRIEKRSLVGSVDPRMTWVFSELSAQLSGRGDKAKADPLFLEGLLIIVRSILLNRLGEAENKASTKLSQDNLLAITDFIERSLDQGFGIGFLAEMIDMPTQAFARSFMLATGQTPHQYVLARRIARAQELLATGKMPLADIAYACGFASQSHMTDVFRQKLGVTPGRYRKELRG